MAHLGCRSGLGFKFRSQKTMLAWIRFWLRTSVAAPTYSKCHNEILASMLKYSMLVLAPETLLGLAVYVSGGERG